MIQCYFSKFRNSCHLHKLGRSKSAVISSLTILPSLMNLRDRSVSHASKEHQCLRSPTDASNQFHTFFLYNLANRNNNIKIVIIYIVNFSIRSSVGKFCPH